MAEHTIETRILLRYDTLSNWLTSTVILKPGEAAIAVSTFDTTIGNTNDHPEHTPPAVGIKVGDGYHYFSELPWVQAVAGDVYNWAKQQTKPTYNANEIQGLTTLIQQYINELNPGGGGDITVEARSYRLQKGTGDNANKYYLQSKGANDASWVTDELNYIDLGDLALVMDWLQEGIENYWTIGGYITTKLNTMLASLTYEDVEDATKVVTAVNQTNGLISVTRRPLSASNMSGTLSVLNGGTGLDTIPNETLLVGTGGNTLSTRPIENVLVDNENFTTNHAIIKYIADATAGLTGAMHYIDEATVEITNGSSVNPRIGGYNFLTARAGDVITFGAKEFVWTGSYWRLMGDEGSYAIKGSIVDRDIADDAEIAQSKISGLTVSLDSKVDKIIGKQLSTNDYTTEEQLKLAGIEENAQRNYIEHVYVNGNEVFPTIVDGKNNTLSLRISALTEEEEAKISGIEAGAQVNRIEHIFLNETELNIGTIRNLSKSVNIVLNEFTDAEKAKLATVETGAQANIINSIFFNNVQFSPNEDKEVHITLDEAALALEVLRGAQVPAAGNTLEEVPISQDKKLQLSRTALTGDVKDLKQTADEFITFYCGTSTEVI